jgi:hypothetical protein
LTSGATGMSHAPEFIDNRDGNTLAEALARVLGSCIPGGLDGATVRPEELAIASGPIRSLWHIAGLAAWIGLKKSLHCLCFRIVRLQGSVACSLAHLLM